MKAVKKISIIFLILGGFRPAMGAPLQQGPSARINYPAITGQPINSKPKDTVINFVRDTSFNHIDTKLKAAALRLKQKAVLAKEYLAANGFNSDICFMVDMSIPSGKNRFFVYNIKKDSVEFTSLVSHGSGSWKPNCDDQLVFSNLTNSNATSLGRYKIALITSTASSAFISRSPVHRVWASNVLRCARSYIRFRWAQKTHHLESKQVPDGGRHDAGPAQKQPHQHDDSQREILRYFARYA